MSMANKQFGHYIIFVFLCMHIALLHADPSDGVLVLRDPTKPLFYGTGVASIRLPELTSIVSGIDKFAVVDGEVLSVGDRHHGYQLTRINEGSIVLVKGNNEFVISLDDLQ